MRFIDVSADMQARNSQLINWSLIESVSRAIHPAIHPSISCAFIVPVIQQSTNQVILSETLLLSIHLSRNTSISQSVNTAINPT